MAEYIFKHISKGLDVYAESKAVSSEEIGNPIYPPASRELDKMGIPYGNHRARKMSKSDYGDFDYIIVMEQYNIPRLMNIIGSDPDNKVYRLLDFTDTPGDIEDPWYTGNFSRVYEQISKGCSSLLDMLKSTGKL